MRRRMQLEIGQENARQGISKAEDEIRCQQQIDNNRSKQGVEGVVSRELVPRGVCSC